MRGIVTAKEISFVNRRHVSVDKLNAALVDIINRYNVLKLPGIWGDGTHLLSSKCNMKDYLCDWHKAIAKIHSN